MYNEAFIRNLSDKEFVVVVENNIGEDSVELGRILLASAIRRIIKTNKEEVGNVRTK